MSHFSPHVSRSPIPIRPVISHSTQMADGRMSHHQHSHNPHLLPRSQTTHILNCEDQSLNNHHENTAVPSRTIIPPPRRLPPPVPTAQLSSSAPPERLPPRTASIQWPFANMVDSIPLRGPLQCLEEEAQITVRIKSVNCSRPTFHCVDSSRYDRLEQSADILEAREDADNDNDADDHNHHSSCSMVRSRKHEDEGQMLRAQTGKDTYPNQKQTRLEVESVPEHTRAQSPKSTHLDHLLNDASAARNNINSQNGKRHCLLSGHIFRKFEPHDSTCLPSPALGESKRFRHKSHTTNVPIGPTVYIPNHSSDIFEVCNSVCNLCSRKWKHYAFQCEIPACRIIVCTACKRRLETEERSRAVLSWTYK